MATLKEFRIRFDINSFERHLQFQSSKTALSQWLEYECSRKVERLDLDLSASHYTSLRFPSLNYPLFPDFPNQRHDGFSLNSLKVLSLIVHDSNELSNLEVCGSLKRLELFYCSNLNRVKVSAPYLTSVTIMRLKELVLENVPMLVELSASCGWGDISLEDLVTALSCCISQLEILNLLVLENPKGGIVAFPDMLRLKKLVVGYVSMNDESRILLTSLFTASPYLQEFVLKIHSHCSSSSAGEVGSDTRFFHQHLKVFKLYGYYGQSSDVELVRYILDNCIVLMKVVVDRQRYCPRGGPSFSSPCVVTEQTAKEQLEAHIPQHIELVIL